MKKAVFTLTLLCTLAALIWGAVFFWKHLRGIRPALTSPSRDIAALVEKAQADATSVDLPLQLPPGFSISLFAKGLENPRVMVLDSNSTMLVSIPSKGWVVALPDQDRDGIADRAVTVIDGLKRPHGLAFRCAPECRLYIAEEDEVNVCSYDPKNLKAVKLKKIAGLPEGAGHVTRTLLFLPAPHDDRLLISVGSSCNVCNEDDWRRSKILAVPADGGKLTVFASGLRNSVFMTVHPRTGKAWATEMGRDLLGDDLPPDEINIIEQGRDYGWPFCFGRNVHDANFDPSRKRRCGEPETFPSHIDVPAHSAPLGLAFSLKASGRKSSGTISSLPSTAHGTGASRQDIRSCGTGWIVKDDIWVRRILSPAGLQKREHSGGPRTSWFCLREEQSLFQTTRQA